VLLRLRSFGVDEVIVNAHYRGNMIEEFLEARENFGMHIKLSPEETLLDTGGGLRKASHFFLGPGSSIDEPFILHNVDVLSTIDLGGMVQFHREQGALATLAVQHRTSSRYLLFDEKGEFCGRRSDQRSSAEASSNGTPGDQMVRLTERTEPLAFTGIHVLSPRIFDKMSGQGVFSVIDAYLQLASQGEKVVAFRADDCYWRDVGRAENVAAAEQDVASGLLAI